MDAAVFMPHGLYLGLPAATMTTAAHLKAGDWVYASNQMPASAVTVKKSVPGVRAGVLVSAGCCAVSDASAYPAGVDAILYDYQPNVGGQCQADRCQLPPMNCGGSGGLPVTCQNEPSYRCTTEQHTTDFKRVHDVGTLHAIGMWVMPAWYSLATSMTCPAAGMPVPVDWGKLAAGTDGYIFNLVLHQEDVKQSSAAAQAALDAVRAGSPQTPVWVMISLTYTRLCAMPGTCTTGPPKGCDPAGEAGKLGPLIAALQQVRATAGDKQIDGVLLLADPCENDVVDALLKAVRP